MNPVDQDWLQRLRAALAYNQETGEFRWKVRRSANAKAGSVAGSTDSSGHRQIKFETKTYLAHRLAWVMTHGRWPEMEIDHVNRDRTDNRLINLRECSHAENSKNRNIYASNTSGTTGVHWDRNAKRWIAYIGGGREKRHLGCFSSIEAAAAARSAAEKEVYGDFSPSAERKRRMYEEEQR